MRLAWIHKTRSGILMAAAALMVLSVSLSFNGGRAWAADEKPTPQPKAVFPEVKYTFPTIMEGTEIKHDFMIENHGQAPLIIQKVQPD